MRTLLAHVLFASVAFGTLPARATTMVPLDLRALTQRAEVVVAGRVLATRASWTSGHDAIYTDVTVHVTRVLTGPLVAGQELVVRTEGGSVDGVGMMVHGAPRFVAGEDVVLFVQRRGAVRWVVGMSQGKLDLVGDGHGAQRLVRNLAGVDFTRAPTPDERTLPVRTLDELDVAVKRIAAEPRP